MVSRTYVDGVAMTESGVALSDYGDYLNDLISAGYDFTGEFTNEEQHEVLSEWIYTPGARQEKELIDRQKQSKNVFDTVIPDSEQVNALALIDLASRADAIWLSGEKRLAEDLLAREMNTAGVMIPGAAALPVLGLIELVGSFLLGSITLSGLLLGLAALLIAWGVGELTDDNNEFAVYLRGRLVGYAAGIVRGKGIQCVSLDAPLEGSLEWRS